MLAPLLLLSASLWVSTAKVDITPSEPLPLGGYTERGARLSEPGGDHLFARAVVFTSGKTRIAMVSAEMLTIPESLVREVRRRIPSDVTLFLAATHTHSAPDSQMLNERMTFSIPGIAKFNPKWLDWYAARIAQSVTTALGHSKPLEGLDLTERHVAANVGRRKFASPDTMLTVVWPHSPYRRRPPIFLEYAAHGTVLGAKNMRLSGDWPGEVASALGTPIFQGAIGDVLPFAPEKDEHVALQNEAIRVLQGIGPPFEPAWSPGQPIRAVSFPISLNPVKAHPTMAKAYGVPAAFAQGIVQQFAPPFAQITAVRLGKLAIVGVPGEPTSILGREIRDAGRRMGFSSVLVCSHVNGWMGYILDPEDFDRGGYEATLSFYGREEGAKVVEAGIEALKELAR